MYEGDCILAARLAEADDATKTKLQQAAKINGGDAAFGKRKGKLQ